MSEGSAPLQSTFYLLQQMTAKRTDPMTPKANDTEFNEIEAL